MYKKQTRYVNKNYFAMQIFTKLVTSIGLIINFDSYYYSQKGFKLDTFSNLCSLFKCENICI